MSHGQLKTMYCLILANYAEKLSNQKMSGYISCNKQKQIISYLGLYNNLLWVYVVTIDLTFPVFGVLMM